MVRTPRMARPTVLTGCGLVVVTALAALAQTPKSSPPSLPNTGPAATAPHTTWRDYAGGADGSQYSALKQIDRSNVQTLQIAWTYPTGDGGNYLFNPLVVDGVMYVLAKGNSIVALDAAEGKEIWVHETGRGRITTRGINYWESPDRSERRLLFSHNQFLQAIDARTGQSIASFGVNGRVDLREGLDRDPAKIAVQSATPGRVFENLIILGSATNQEYRFGAGRHPGLRRADRRAGVDVSHRPAPWRIRLRHLAGGCVENDRRRERVVGAVGGRETRHRLHPHWKPEIQFLWRQPKGRESVRRLPDRARCPHRKAHLALPDGPPRHLGLRQRRRRRSS